MALGVPSDWTNRRNKEQRASVKKAIDEDRKNTPPTPKPLYGYDPYAGVGQNTLHRRRLEAEKERKFWIIGSVIIGITIIIAVGVVYWAATS